MMRKRRNNLIMKFNLNLDKDKIIKKLEDIENKLDEEESKRRQERRQQ